MDATVDVRRGIWDDYDPGTSIYLGRRILVPNNWAFPMVSLLSVWISVLAPCYWKLIKCLLIHLTKLYKPGVRRVRSTVGSWLMEKFEHLENLDEHRKRTAEDTAFEICRLMRTTVDMSWMAKILSCFAILFCLAIFIAVAIAATVVSFIALDNVAVATSDACGVWVPNSTVNVVDPMDKIMLEVEDIYRECYENPSEPACNLFPYTALGVIETHDAECPFLGDICVGGNNSAFRLDTEYRDSIYLGLNSPTRPTYRRTATCAPLAAENYTVATLDPITNITTIMLNFGSKTNSSGQTYNVTRSFEFEQLLTPTGYDVKTASTCLGEFEPMAELSSRSASSKGYAFLMFVNIFHVQFPAPSNDPIFPATTQTSCPNSNDTCYSNTILAPAVLGCIERAEVCYPRDSGPDDCVDVWASNAIDNMLSANWTGAEETYLTMLGLSYSDFGNVLSTRHGLLLNATQQIIGHRLSQALDLNQWKLEVSRLFDMGLLRAQMEMLAVARGMRASNAGYYNTLPPERRGICQKVKFQAKGYTNISFLGMMLAICLPLILAISGLEIGDELLWIWLSNSASRLARRVAWILLKGRALVSCDELARFWFLSAQRRPAPWLNVSPATIW